MRIKKKNIFLIIILLILAAAAFLQFTQFGYLMTVPYRSAFAEIAALYLLPEYCGRGFGLRLMEAAMEQLKEYPEIFLWVFKENKRAIRFYQKCGFNEDGTEKFVPGIEAKGIRMVLNR